MDKLDSVLAKLKDIKPNVEVTGYNYNELLLIIAAILALILIVAVAIIIYKKRPKRRIKLTREQRALKALKELKLEPTKDMLYTFSQNAKIVVKDEAMKQRLDEILEKSDEYKYNPNAPKVPQELLKEIEEFIKDIK